MYVLLEQRTYSYYDNTKDVNVYVEYKSDNKENVEAMKIVKEEEARLHHQDNNKKSIVYQICLLYTSPSPRDLSTSRMPSSA